MKKINVLHFSDLHLQYDNEVEFDSFFQKIKNCILEIKSQIHLITITGDLIDKGKVSDFSNFYQKFIVPISEVSKCPISNIFCVPGNHDAERDTNIPSLREEFKNNEKTGLHFGIKKGEFRKICARFQDFDDFNHKLHPNSKSYGVDLIKLDNINIALIRLNSAVYSHDKDDYQNLGISKLQLDDLTKQYKCIKEQNDISLSIALMHHPDEWLRSDEKEHMWDYFTSTEKLPVDIIMHGHTHESKIAGKIDLDSFVLSLVTGTTYENGNKEEDPFNSCRFALYGIDIEEKTIQGNLYIANNKGKFVPDTTSYNSVNHDGGFWIPYDKSAFEKTSSLNLPVPIDHHIKMSNDHVEIFDDMVNKVWEFEKACRRHLDSFASVPEAEFKKNKDAILKDWFVSIANCARNCLFDSQENDDVRAHFRVYENGKHVHFCATIGERQITPIEWKNGNNLIFHAYDKKRSLVKSLNPKIFFDTKGEWNDFLTVPIFYQYNGKEIPKYSFGISIKGNNKAVLSKKLEILSFLRFEALIDSLCASFYRYYLA